MSTIIASINEKGGIGKTSIVFNVGWYFAEQGKKVLMIDLDGQRANLTFFCGVSKPEGLTTAYDILVRKEKIQKSILNIESNLDLIPATDEVGSLDENNASLAEFKYYIEEIRDKYDYIFIDVSPKPDRSHALALTVSDYALIPMLPDVTCLAANMGVAESIQMIQENVNPELKVLGIVFNRYNFMSSFNKDVWDTAEGMAEALESKVLKTKVRNNIALSKNVGSYEGVTRFANKSKASDDIRALAKEIEREVRANGR